MSENMILGKMSENMILGRMRRNCTLFVCLFVLCQVMKPQEAELVTEISKVSRNTGYTGDKSSSSDCVAAVVLAAVVQVQY